MLLGIYRNSQTINKRDYMFCGCDYCEPENYRWGSGDELDFEPTPFEVLEEFLNRTNKRK